MNKIYNPYLIDFDKYKQKHVIFESFTNKLHLLSKSILSIILDINTQDLLKILSEDDSLSNAQSADLTRIVRDILLGDIYIGDMPSLIQLKLQISLHQAQEISSRIVSELFKPAIDDIKKMQLTKFKDRILQGTKKEPTEAQRKERTIQQQISGEKHVTDLRKE